MGLLYLLPASIVWRKSYTFLLCTAKQMGHILNIVTYEGNCLVCSSKRCVSYCYLIVTFLQVNVSRFVHIVGGDCVYFGTDKDINNLTGE